MWTLKIPMKSNESIFLRIHSARRSFVSIFLLANFVLTVDGVCSTLQNGKLECQFHQSEILQTGPSPSSQTAAAAAAGESSLSSHLNFNHGATATAAVAPSSTPDTSYLTSLSGTSASRQDSARLFWTTGGTGYSQRFSKPQPKVVRISQHRPSPSQPSGSGSYFNRRFLPFIDTEDEDLLSVSQVQVHESTNANTHAAQAQASSGSAVSASQQVQSYSQYPQQSTLVDGIDYGDQVEVSHIAFPSHQGNRNFDLHDGHSHDAAPPRRLDSEIEEIHSILPSLLDPVRIKKIIYPKNRRARLQKYGRSSEVSEEQEQQQDHIVAQQQVIPSENVYDHTQMESHGQVHNQGNLHLQNSKTLSSPLLLKPSSLHGAAGKKKPFRIQILGGKQEHQKPSKGFGSYHNKKSTLLLPATKEYHEQYKVPYKGSSVKEVYASDYSYPDPVHTNAVPSSPTQLVSINHHVYFNPQQQQQSHQPSETHMETQPQLHSPAPTPVLSTGPLIIKDDHQAAELKPIKPFPQPQPYGLLPPLPQPEALHGQPIPDQMMAESINVGHGGFYHHQQYVAPPPPSYVQPVQGYNQYPMAPAPAPYYPVNYHAPAQGPLQWNYNGQPQLHPQPHQPSSTPNPVSPVISEKESVLHALKTLSQSKPDLIKDVVSEHKHEGLGDDVVEFVSSSQKENDDTGTTIRKNDMHFYTKNGTRNKITVDVSAVEHPDPKVSLPIDQVLSLLLSNQKYSSSGKNYFKNSFTQELDSGTKNHPNDLAKVLYDMGILQRIAAGTLTVEQMELVNKLIDLTHQEQELEEEIEFYMDKSGRMRKKKPAKYIVPRTASSRGSGERDQRRSKGQSSYSAYEEKREEYEKRRRRPENYEYGYNYPGYKGPRHDRHQDREREDEHDRYRFEDRHYYRERGRERHMLLSNDHRYQNQAYQHQDTAPPAPPPQFQPPALVPATESPVNLNIIIPTEIAPQPGPKKSLNDTIPSDTLNLLATLEVGHSQGHEEQQRHQNQGTGYSYTNALPTGPFPMPPLFPQLASVFKNHPFLHRMKDEWWKGVGSMLSDLQRHQIYQQFGVDAGPGYNYTAPAQTYEHGQATNEVAHHYKGHGLGGIQTSPIMVQILSTIGLLGSFMLLAFIGIHMQKGSGILSGLLPKRIHFRSPVQFINPNNLPTVKGQPAYGNRGPPVQGSGNGQLQVASSYRPSQEVLTESMELLRDKLKSSKEPYNLHIHLKGEDVIESKEEPRGQWYVSRPSAESEGHEDNDEDDSEDDDQKHEALNTDESQDSSSDDDQSSKRRKKLSTTAATALASDAVFGVTTRIPFDDSFELYLANAAKLKVANNPELIVRESPAATATTTTPAPVYRKPSPPTTAATPSTTAAPVPPTSKSTSTLRPWRPKPRPPRVTTTTARSTTTMTTETVRPEAARTTTATTTTTTGFQPELIESEETIITNTIVPKEDYEHETTLKP